MQLSIIIPVYNVEEYIEKCIISLQNQDIEDNEYEIIIINDGSPDNSRDIIIALMKTYSNIVFIDQVNKGVSLARNAGIDKAKGKYLLFIDPDDYVEENSFKRIIAAANTYNANVTFLGYTFLNENGTIKKEMFFSNMQQQTFKGIDAYFYARKENTLDPDRTWAILFQTNFINKTNLRYISDMPYLEDGEFIARVLCLADICVFEGNSFYLRTTRAGSATNSKLFYSSKSINGFIKAAINLKHFSTNNTLTIPQKIFINHPIAKFTLLSVEASATLNTSKKLLQLKSQLIKVGLSTLSLQGVNNPYNKMAKMYNASPFLYIIYLWYTKIKTSILYQVKSLAVSTFIKK